MSEKKSIRMLLSAAHDALCWAGPVTQRLVADEIIRELDTPTTVKRSSGPDSDGAITEWITIKASDYD